MKMLRAKRRLPICVLVVMISIVTHRQGIGQQNEPQQYALLIGVSKYSHARMNDTELQFPEADAKAVADLLQRSGFMVVTLVGSQATQQAVAEELQKVAKQGTADGVMLIGMFGHGVQYGNDAYFGPYDTSIRIVKDSASNIVRDDDGRPKLEPDPESMISMRSILDALTACGAGNRILLADCCREDPSRARGRAFGSKLRVADLPPGTAAIFACSASEKAFEHSDWGHGAFTQALLERLSSAGNNLTANTLSVDLYRDVDRKVRSKTNGKEKQTVNPIINGIVSLYISGDRSFDEQLRSITKLALDNKISVPLFKQAKYLFAQNEEDMFEEERLLRQVYSELATGEISLSEFSSGVKNKELSEQTVTKMLYRIGTPRDVDRLFDKAAVFSEHPGIIAPLIWTLTLDREARSADAFATRLDIHEMHKNAVRQLNHFVQNDRLPVLLAQFFGFQSVSRPTFVVEAFLQTCIDNSRTSFQRGVYSLLLAQHQLRVEEYRRLKTIADIDIRISEMTHSEFDTDGIRNLLSTAKKAIDEDDSDYQAWTNELTRLDWYFRVLNERPENYLDYPLPVVKNYVTGKIVLRDAPNQIKVLHKVVESTQDDDQKNKAINKLSDVLIQLYNFQNSAINQASKNPLILRLLASTAATKSEIDSWVEPIEILDPKSKIAARVARMNGMKAPDLAGEDLDGEPIKLVDFRGKIVLLDLWGFW